MISVCNLVLFLSLILSTLKINLKLSTTSKRHTTMIQITGQYCHGGVEKWTRIQEISTGISTDEVYSGKHTTEPEIGLKHKPKYEVQLERGGGTRVRVMSGEKTWNRKGADRLETNKQNKKNRTGLTKEIQSRCGGKLRRVRRENKKETERGTPERHSKHIKPTLDENETTAP